MSQIFLLYENEDWCTPLTDALVRNGIPFKRWPLVSGSLDLDSPPPEGIFFNRMSASAHSRNHRYSPEYAAAVLYWLESHDRRVINGHSVLQLELSKAAQYRALARAGIRTPRTSIVLGENELLQVADKQARPFIIKHNRAGKGLGVKLLKSASELEQWLKNPQCPPPVDGLWLLQEYIQAPEPFITRVEFIAGEYVYAVRVSTEQGFELCPADVCELDEHGKSVTPANDDGKFEIIRNFSSPLIEQYQKFLQTHNIEVAALEFIQDGDNNCYTYDINTNTNYNSQAEQKAGVCAMDALAGYLDAEFRALNP